MTASIKSHTKTNQRLIHEPLVTDDAAFVTSRTILLLVLQITHVFGLEICLKKIEVLH